MATLVKGTKYIVNQWTKGLGKQGDILIYGETYNDARMLMYYLRSGQISPVVETVRPTLKSKSKKQLENTVYDDMAESN
jgi:hypothetical protein